MRNYKSRYKEEGLLIDYHIGRSSYLSFEEQSQLITELESKVYLQTSAIIFYVKREFGVVYKIGGMTTLLHQLGFSYKKPKGVPGKAKREEQEVFIEEYNKVKEKGLVYFADSTHPRERDLYIVLDNAPYNKSNRVRDLAKELGIKILYLPPYSPNLNPIERLWKFIKKKVMANRYYPDIETFQRELMLF